MRLTPKKSQLVGEHLGIRWNIISPSIWHTGMKVELEHGSHDKKTDVTNGDLIIVGKIVLAHLKEFPDYYQRLKKMEMVAEKYWDNREKPRITSGSRLSKNMLTKQLK